MAKKVVETPLMKQYYEIKRKHPDAILLFRVGDFYETFSDDAIVASKILGITLTRRANGAAQYIELAGFPHHALDNYLCKLVRAGQRVAICEQLEDPKKTKKLVKRGVTELVTPGVSFDDNVLDHKENNFLASVHLHKDRGGIAFLDVSTGEFMTAEGSLAYIDQLLNSFAPKEVLYDRSQRSKFKETFGDKFFTYEQEDWIYTDSAAKDRLNKHFGTKNLKGFGVNNMSLAIIASGAALYYMDLTEHHKLNHVTTLARIEGDQYVWLDKFTIRNLELYGKVRDGGCTLADVLDYTISPMGSRLLRRWIAFPLKNIAAITERHEIVEYYFKEADFRDLIHEELVRIGDMERIVSKLAVGRVSPRELVQLKVALQAVENIQKSCLQTGHDSVKKIGEQLNPCELMHDRIEREISPDPPSMLQKGGVIRSGFCAELDELRNLAYSGKDYLKQLQEREAERTGISSLKIAYNNVFGYYIEVRNTHKDKVPAEWIRKQTLVSAERYITEELKRYEEKILGAEEKIHALEQRLFTDLVSSLSDYMAAMLVNANQVAQLDCLLSLMRVAEKNNYIRPLLNESKVINIKQGRHPVIETQLPLGEEYVPNDVLLDQDKQQIIVVTGPNMAGKSALLRQTALIVLMAQMGSFVPAESAEIGYVDKIFTRVGASDNISAGESTFMVEMNEAASILNNVSTRSLILFDELGRGTSTYDGISIAWSILEYLHEHPRGQARTLFATHYHELNEMAKSFPRIVNFNVSVREVDNKVVFLRKLQAGGSAHSFGIHVAKMAGMPNSIVKRADEILLQLEKNNRQGEVAKPMGEVAETREGMQLSLFQLDDPVLSQIRDDIAAADLNNLTPMDAMNMLYEIKKLIGL